MRIREITVLATELRLKVPFTTSFGTQSRLIHPFVKITTTDGYIGYGEIPTLNEPVYKPESDYKTVLLSLKEYVIPSIIRLHEGAAATFSMDEYVRTYQWIKGAQFAKSGIEAALWDTRCQIEKKPLWRLWGGTRKNIVVGVSVGGKTSEDILSRVNQAVDLGYKRIKIKIWPGFDFSVLRKIRGARPGLLLQVDANSSFAPTDWKTLKKLDSFNLLLIEQPLYDSDIVFHAELSQKLTTPICLDESIHSLLDVEQAVHLWKEKGILDRLTINIKPPRVGGFIEALRIAQYCKKNGVKTWIGGMLDSAWGKAFNLQLNSVGSISLPGDHFSPTGDYFESDVTDAPLRQNNGIFTISNTRGVGVHMDESRLKKMSKLIFSTTL